VKCDISIDEATVELEELIVRLKALNQNSAANIKENIINGDTDDIKDIEREIKSLVGALEDDEIALKRMTEAEK
jgi:hypothetical protein